MPLGLFKTNRKKATLLITLYNIRKKLLKQKKDVFSIITTKYMDDNIADYRITIKHNPTNYVYFFIDKPFGFMQKFNQVSIGHLSNVKNLGNYYKSRLLDKKGIAFHILLRNKKFDDTFDQWTISKHNGISIAHVAAKYELLPDSFDNWGIRDNNRRSVAHVAALYKTLPPKFNSWNLTDNDGVRVFDLYRKSKLET